MDSLVNLCLDGTGVEIIPPSVGQFCTNLVTFSLIGCKLKRIEGNFHLLTSLKDLILFGCGQHHSQHSTSYKNLTNCIRLHSFHQDSLVRLKFLQFPRFLRKLNLSYCDLGDGDIPSDIHELLYLQVLCLNGNNFSRLHSSLSRIPCLKFLNLAFCRSLVELLDLPSSLAILKANQCDSLESVGDLSDYKWLWKDGFMSVDTPGDSSLISYKTSTLQLPHNWYSHFSGFLLYANRCRIWECSIVIKWEISMDSQHDHDHGGQFDKNPESYEYEQVGYVPFGSLRHIPWWNSTCTNITLQIHAKGNPKVELVPRKSKLGGSREKAKATLDCSECWEEDQKTFEIMYDSNSSNIHIVWDHGYD